MCVEDDAPFRTRRRRRRTPRAVFSIPTTSSPKFVHIDLHRTDTKTAACYNRQKGERSIGYSPRGAVDPSSILATAGFEAFWDSLSYKVQADLAAVVGGALVVYSRRLFRG